MNLGMIGMMGWFNIQQSPPEILYTPGWLPFAGFYDGNKFPELFSVISDNFKSGNQMVFPGFADTMFINANQSSVLEDTGQLGKLLTAVDFESVAVSTNAPTNQQVKLYGMFLEIYCGRDRESGLVVPT